MKIRNGFVSNSSSSSFVCDVSGESVVYYDGLSEIDAVTCEDGHSFFEDYLLDGWDEDEDFDRYEVKKKYCPICQMKHIMQNDLLEYTLIKLGGRKAVEEEIKKFKNYDEFISFLNDNRVK